MDRQREFVQRSPVPKFKQLILEWNCCKLTHHLVDGDHAMQKIRSSVNQRQVLAGLGAMGLVGAGFERALAATTKPGKDAILLVIDFQNCVSYRAACCQ
jgi:hypothetical protein